MFDIILILFATYIVLFGISIVLRDNSIADVFWGIGFMMIAVLSWLQSSQALIQNILTALILLWGIRLTFHISVRKIQEKREDPRYLKWREEWGSGWYFFIRSFLQVYILQMILMIIIAIPIFIVNLEYIHTPGWLMNGGEPILLATMWVALTGIGISLFGLIFEMIADIQLARFIQTKKPGQIFTTGLYRYSRHPNYFGESMFWLGIGLISLPFSILGMISWMMITGLLLFVSGVPLQEARYRGRPEWEEYRAKTSVFFPWFPHK